MKRKFINSFIYIYYLIPFFLITGPALPDIALSIIAILGIYVFIKNLNIIFEGKILKNFTLFFFSFFLILVLGSFFSHIISISLITSIAFIRFYFFSIFILFIILNDYQKINYHLYIILSSILLLISIDGIFEYFNNQNIFGTSTNAYMQNRISGLFGKEWIIGTYIVKLLPLYIYLFFEGNKKNMYFFILILFFSYTMIFLSGERAALLLSLIPIFMMVFFFRNNNKLFFLLFLIFLLFLFIINNFDNSFFLRLIEIINPSEKYLRMFEVSLNIFLSSPIFGEGVYSFRYLCDYSEFSDFGLAACSTHPHNIYLQLLAEAGIFAFILVLFIFMLSVVLILKNIFYGKVNVSLSFLTASITINFFPLLPSLNIFYNWHDVIIFFPVPFILYEFAKKELVASGGLEPPRE